MKKAFNNVRGIFILTRFTIFLMNISSWWSLRLEKQSCWGWCEIWIEKNRWCYSENVYFTSQFLVKFGMWVVKPHWMWIASDRWDDPIRRQAEGRLLCVGQLNTEVIRETYHSVALVNQWMYIMPHQSRMCRAYGCKNKNSGTKLSVLLETWPSIRMNGGEKNTLTWIFKKYVRELISKTNIIKY